MTDPLRERLKNLADFLEEEFYNVRFARQLNGGKPLDHEPEAICVRLWEELKTVELLREALAALSSGAVAPREAWQPIADELEKAQRKFPTWPTRGTDAAAIVAEECGELQQAVLQATYEGGTVEHVRKEAIQTATMAIQFLLNLPDTKFERGEQVAKRTLPASPGASRAAETPQGCDTCRRLQEKLMLNEQDHLARMAREERQLESAWWGGRDSATRIPIATATGPMLREECRKDVAALLREATPPAETPEAQEWRGEPGRAVGARILALGADGGMTLEDEIGEFYVWPAPARAATPPPELPDWKSDQLAAMRTPVGAAGEAQPSDSRTLDLRYFTAKGEYLDGPHYGKDCPAGKVQVEFVGVSPSLRFSPYGWKPSDHAFLDIYVDGRRFNIQVGDYESSEGTRRGLHIIGDLNMAVDKHSLNAVDVYLPPVEEARPAQPPPEISR